MTTYTFSQANMESSSQPQSDTAELTILYGSETGNAEFLAHQICESATADGLQVEIAGLDEWLAREEHKLARLLIVTSTHDNGHMPGNANNYWNWLQVVEPFSLEGLPYAILSIGDSMYEDFCKAGQDLDDKLEELGALKVFDTAECDVDFEFTAGEWYPQALEALLDEDPWQQREIEILEELKHLGEADLPEETLYPTKVIAARRLSGPDSNKTVMHFELQSVGDVFSYEPGDSISLIPVNSESLVEEWITAFNADRNQTVECHGDSKSLFDALRYNYELSLPHPGLLLALAKLRPDNELAQDAVGVIERGDRETLEAWLWDRDVLDVLTELDCLDIPLPVVLEQLRPIQQRDYSISSSPLVDDTIHITVSAVEYESHGRHHNGAASNFLQEAAQTGESFLTKIQPGREFSLPEDDKPVIMIGPGVGVAPFRSFLRHREAVGAKGRNWLFFGDQQRKCDYLYETEFEDLQQRESLKVSLAFSRDQSEKHYVQHELQAHADEIREWIDKGAYIFICGDKVKMARDVDNAFMQIIANGERTITAGIKFAQLKDSGRYVKDVY